MSATAGTEAWPLPHTRVEPSELAPGGRGRIVVAIEVADGCHVQSHTPSEPFMIPTELDLDGSDDLTFGEALYPDAETERFDWSPVVLDVYRGIVEIVVPVRVEAGAGPGTRAISGRVRYQACTETACLPPVEHGVEVRLEVMSGEGERG